MALSHIHIWLGVPGPSPPPDGYGGGPPQVMVDAPPPVGWVWLVHFAFEVICFTQNDLVIAEC